MESKRTRDVPLGIQEEMAAEGDHIAFLWETEEEFTEAVGFLEMGLDEGDNCVVFGHDQANRRVLQILREKGRDTDALQEEGRLSVVAGAPEPDALLKKIGGVFQDAVDGGAPLVRLLGNIGWSREGWPDEHGCLVFEAEVTGAARSFPSVVVCMYDVKGLSGEVVLHGAFETHPLTFHGNLLRENPCFTPMDEFLERLQVVGIGGEGD